MKIDSCIIIKNEEKNIENLIKQFLKFSNEIHITDTGSTDGTIKIIKNIQKLYKNIYLHHFDWVMDFSKARNYSLTCYNCNADYQFWCDADDELNDKLIETLKQLSNDNNIDDELFYINYKYYEKNNKLHYRTSLLKVSSKFKWYDPIHEYVKVFTTSKTNYDYFNNGSLIIHHPSKQYNHCERNLEIFLNMEKNNYNFTKRNLYYFARELSNNKLYDRSKEIYKKCIDKENEKNSLHELNSCINLFRLNDGEAIDYFNKLLKKDIYRKDLIYYAGEYYFKKNQYYLAKLYLLMALECEKPNNKNIMFYDNSIPLKALDKLTEVEKKLKQ